MAETKRKTTIPIVSNLPMVDWLLKNCTDEEISYMAGLSSNRNGFKILNSIFTRLTDYNIHQVFLAENLTPEQLSIFRASRRGEVAGLKNFAIACQLANKKLEGSEK